MAKNIKLRLIVAYWLQFAIWGSYLTSMGGYLGSVGLGDNIGWFYSIQGVVSIFLPAIFGIIADRWVPAQRLLGVCHLAAAAFMIYTGYVGMTSGDNVQFSELFTPYVLSVAFYTIANNFYINMDIEFYQCFQHPLRSPYIWLLI